MFGVFDMDSDSRWEIFGHGDQGSTQNFDTHLLGIVVWPVELFWKKHTKSKGELTFWKTGMSQTSRIFIFRRRSRRRPSALDSKGLFIFPVSQVIRMVSFPVSPGSQIFKIAGFSSISRFTDVQNVWFCSISRITCYQTGRCSSISRFPGHQNVWFPSIPRFPGHQNDRRSNMFSPKFKSLTETHIS